ncbi:MAG: S4 domain-containing protein [Methylococcales bacterium]|nr:S4 domain-containing protein [Methylococcales bacterium]
MPELETLRIDKWLWASRFFKSRKLASDAVSGGKVHVNGQRCKPSKEIKIGSQVLIHKDQCRWEIQVLGLNKQRRPASEAVLLYEESVESHDKRQQQIIDNKEQRHLLPHSEREHRPNKKQRRQIHQFKQS